MSDFKKVVLKVAQANPEFRDALKAELSKLYSVGSQKQARSEFSKGDIVLYKGRKYRVEYAGKTKYGMKAKLKFLNGSKSFWVPLDMVSHSSSSSRGRGRMVNFKYWNGMQERMPEEHAQLEEDMGNGRVV